MTPELTILAVSIILHMGVMAAYSVKANRELGPKYPLSPRDGAPPKPLSQSCSRLQRVMNNSFESLILFAPAALMVGLTGQSNGVTATLAVVFLIARILYIPAYVMGLVPGRSLIWGFGFFATLALAIAALI
ncbi:MAPEG family protein [Thioclava sp.]|uniref:MAPEG family protein n=1 Tax=Thioclava sp. TaxID=1933450 RepID=UPI003AA9A9E7